MNHPICVGLKFHETQNNVQDLIVRTRMGAAVLVASLFILAVLGQSLAQDTSCWSNRLCLDHGFTCSEGQDYACINHACTCLTTHTCAHTTDCRDIGACHDSRHREVCYHGKCHCADVSDVFGGLLDLIG